MHAVSKPWWLFRTAVWCLRPFKGSLPDSVYCGYSAMGCLFWLCKPNWFNHCAKSLLVLVGEEYSNYQMMHKGTWVKMSCHCDVCCDRGWWWWWWWLWWGWRRKMLWSLCIQLSTATNLTLFMFYQHLVFMSYKDNFYKVRSALQISMCLLGTGPL